MLKYFYLSKKDFPGIGKVDDRLENIELYVLYRRGVCLTLAHIAETIS